MTPLRKLMLTVSLLAVSSLVSYAQEGILKTIPAHDGKRMTMEQAVLDRSLYPANNYARWISGSTYACHDGKQWKAYDAVTGSEASLTRPAPPAAFSREGSLYLNTPDGERVIAQSSGDGIVYGTSVSRNEFGINDGIFPSPDGKMIAFYRKDETAVTKFPLLDITTRTGSLREIRYPMNGMASEHITLGVYDTADGSTRYLQVDDFDDERYLTGITWSPDGKYIYIQVLSRSQHDMHLNMYRVRDGRFVRTLLTEHNDAWVEPQDPLHFVKGRKDLFIYRTDNRDGYKNLYLVDTLGSVQRMTWESADTEYLGNDGTRLWYATAVHSPAEQQVYSFSFTLRKGKLRTSKPVRLTSGAGWHDVSLSEDCRYLIDSYSAFDIPRRVTLRTATNGALVRELLTAEDPLKDYLTGEVLFGKVKSADGLYDNHYRLYKPANFDPSKKYPVILYVYGGPHSQMVHDSWLGNIRMWEMLMAQKGYVVYVQDNRGTQYHGAAYEKAINRRCGQAEMEDQMVGIRMLQSLPWVDKDRIGVHGWSYGGFMTISLMTTYPDVFKAGVAGGPVIDWKWYEVMYGERYMDTPETNPEGFAATSLIGKAKNLRGRLLICQGAIDNTVVWEHSLSFVQECIRNQIPVDYFPYPVAEHNVFGRDRIHLMDKVTDYFDTWL